MRGKTGVEGSKGRKVPRDTSPVVVEGRLPRRIVDRMGWQFMVGSTDSIVLLCIIEANEIPRRTYLDEIKNSSRVSSSLTSFMSRTY